MKQISYEYINYIFYFIQSLSFVSFSFFVLKPRFSHKLTFYLSIVPVILLFVSSCVFNSYQYTLGYIELLSYSVIMGLYTFILFKDSFLKKIVIPVFSYLFYTAVLGFYYYFASNILNVDWYTEVSTDKVYSIVARLIINITYIFLLYVIYKFCNSSIKLNSIYEYIFFVILPVITFGIVFLSFIILTDTNTSSSAMIALGVISVSMAFVSFMVMSLMLKAAKASRIENQNFLMKKQQEEYKLRILESNKALEEISVIRHDMKNKILCIGDLMSNNNYDEAIKMCTNVQSELTHATVLFHTDNNYLNSILNISYKKAQENNIDIKVAVSCQFEGIGNTDLVAMIGNICDNAIEYLSKIKGERHFELKLSQKGRYYFISGKNNITESVLAKNPQLNTSKSDKANHGHGIKNVKTIASKYNGEADVFEQNNYFIITAMLEIPKKNIKS